MVLPHQCKSQATRFPKATAAAEQIEVAEPICQWEAHAAQQGYAERDRRGAKQRAHTDEQTYLSGGTLITQVSEASDSLGLCDAAGPDARALAVGPPHLRTP